MLPSVNDISAKFLILTGVVKDSNLLGCNAVWIGIQVSSWSWSQMMET